MEKILKKTKIESKKEWRTKEFIYNETSARRMPLGYVIKLHRKKWRLFDKFLCKVNVCYHCKSKNTFHRRQQELGDFVGNIWRMEKVIGGNLVVKKWDFCLDCGKEFLFEYFIFDRV